MNEVIVKRKKTSDKDIKDFFSDYSRAKGRRKVLLSRTISRPMTESENYEYFELGLYISCVDAMVNSLEPVVSQIIREYYINRSTLFSISMNINYCYEHVSYLKNIGCDNIRKMLSGEAVIQNNQSIELIKLINEIVEEKIHEYSNRE